MMGGGQSQGQLDASVLDRIFIGELDVNSVVEETEYGAQITLGEHPHYSKHLKLARVSAALSRLRDPELVADQTPQFTFDLDESPFSEVLFKLFQDHETGFLVVTHEGRRRTIALSAGLPIASNSNLKSEQLGQFLIQKGLISANRAEHLTGVCARESRSLGWGLLSLELIDLPKLMELVQQHARLKILPAFSWTEGTVEFYRDKRGALLPPIINLSFMDMVRAGVWRTLPTDLPSVEKIVGKLLQVQAPLVANTASGAIIWELTELERQLLDETQESCAVPKLLENYRSSAEKSEVLRALFTMTQMGLLKFDASYKPCLKIGLNPLAYQHRSRNEQDVAASQIQEYKLRKTLEDEGRHLFLSHDYRGAAEKFQRLADRQEQATDALGYLAVCTLLINPSRHGKRALELAHQAVSIAEGNALAHAALARIHQEMGKTNLAKRHEKRALVLSEHNPEWLAEIHVLLDTAARVRQEEAEEPMSLAPLLIFASTMIFALFFLSNIVGLGNQEYYYQSSDPFFFYRRVGLLVAGIAGLSLYYRQNPWSALKNLNFRTPLHYVLIALVWGILVGLQSPSQRISGNLYEVFALTMLHVLAEEIFFRGFITRILSERLEEFGLALLGSGLIYGVYHITYQSFWFDTEFWMKWYWMGAITAFAGIPYAWLYIKSKSILAPFIAHLMVSLTMMWMSMGIQL
ncbi:MAG: CPBP family intramembrane metalloprotease [Deltaproteobacteria bacterium]|jgi:membrane protease YdiL (CAAX protease family)|nr:CPBP family intramembrane metalloprotease [Deltaproteobacteria bacterium]MBT6490629.1 CPBP family intramembrane metalloprotease [Deltaproteobacteria bacterium]